MNINDEDQDYRTAPLEVQARPCDPLIFKLIPEVMREIGAVEKNRKNEQQKYSFRGIEDFYQAAHPAFVKHGIFCAPEVLDREATSFEKLNDFGKVTIWRHVTLRVRHRFYAGDGSFVDVTTFGEGLDNSDKASNKAMSGAMKYALIELFSVPTQDVEDSDRTSPETGTQKQVARVAEPKTFTRPAAVQDSGGTKAPAFSDKGTSDAPNGSGRSEPTPPERQPGEDDETFVITPLGEAVAKMLEEKKPADVRKPKNPTFIDGGRQTNFAVEFRKALPKDFSSVAAERLRHDWLGAHFFMDSDGNPSSKGIKVSEFERVKKEACEWARMQK